MLTLLRRYPLTTDGSGANPGLSSIATPQDEEACRMDFDPKASSSPSQVSQSVSQCQSDLQLSFRDWMSIFFFG